MPDIKHMDIEKCLDEVSIAIKQFLEEQGGYENGWYTYVDGTVLTDKDGYVSWSTPKAKEELTVIGRENRGKVLYKTIQGVLKDNNIDKIVIRNKDKTNGYIETKVVYIEETSKIVRL